MDKKIRRKDMPRLKKEYRIENRKKQMRFCSWLFLLSFGILGTIGGIVKIYSWNHDNSQVDVQIAEFDSDIVVEETYIEDVKEEDLVNPPSKVINVNDDYWNYIKLPLMQVNFSELLEKNDDTVGFLKVSGTNINYPVVQTTD
ncbi:MAG: hypothetical protein K2M17_05870, partial [Bacilli bacterium]|nr:hypothetical protein [Bacilli bacterium]